MLYLSAREEDYNSINLLSTELILLCQRDGKRKAVCSLGNENLVGCAIFFVLEDIVL